MVRLFRWVCGCGGTGRVKEDLLNELIPCSRIGGNPAGKYSVAASHCSRGAKKCQNIFFLICLEKMHLMKNGLLLLLWYENSRNSGLWCCLSYCRKY